MIKIDFQFDTQYGTFSDALHLPEDHTFTEAEIEAMKEARRDNWVAIVSAQSEEVSAAVEDVPAAAESTQPPDAPVLV